MLDSIYSITELHQFGSKMPRKQVEEINGDKVTLQQLEHIGDAVLNLAARLLAFEYFGNADSGKIYLTWSDALIANSNFSKTTIGARYAEIQIGRICFQEGLESAVKAAVKFLKKTEVHRKIEEFWDISSKQMK